MLINMVRKMAWWGGFGWGRGRGWGGGWAGPWPGRGPFSYLPPWQRPGWIFGRGACWYLFGNPWMYRYGYSYYPYYPTPYFVPPYPYYYPTPYYYYPWRPY